MVVLLLVFGIGEKIKKMEVRHNKRCERANPKSKCRCRCKGQFHGIQYGKQTTIDKWVGEDKNDKNTKRIK